MHIVLIGDSIFDNGSYVSRGQSVIDQLRRLLTDGDEATLVAVDGATSADAVDQLRRLPGTATHVFVSCGGNDALNEIGQLAVRVHTVGDAVAVLGAARASFAARYELAINAISERSLPMTVCTVYDAIPFVGEPERTALAAFNDVITKTAFSHRAPVIDLRLLCNEPTDYSEVSPIEPSARGGSKIARLVVEVATRHDFSRRISCVYF